MNKQLLAPTILEMGARSVRMKKERRKEEEEGKAK